MGEPENFFEEILGGSMTNSGKTFLQMAAPGPELLREAAEIMKKCTELHFQSSAQRCEEILQYGVSSGNPGIKSALAKYLSETYRNPVDSEDLFINSGSSQGFANMLRHYFKEGDTVFVADPTYFVLLAAARESFHLNIVGIESDDDGIKVDQIEKHLPQLKSKPVSERNPYRALVYVIPVHHNPSGECLTAERCHKLVKLAREYDLLVVADDVYNILTYFPFDGDDASSIKPPRRLFDYDRKTDPDYKGNVVSIGTFSKILSPGLRTGWYELPQRIKKTFEHIYVSDSGGGWSPYTSGLVAAGLEAGIIQKHVAKVRDIYGKRVKGVHDILTKELSQYGVQCKCPHGGIFMWIILPKSCSSKDLLALCGAKVGFITGDRCSVSGRDSNCFRISIAFYQEPELFAAVRTICDAAKKLLSKTS